MMNEGNGMYLVSFTNFAYTKAFNDIDLAIAHMERAGFESVLMTSVGDRLGEFRPLGGGFSFYRYQKSA
jgi:hypothetical protein